MAEKPQGTNWAKWGLIAGAILFILVAVMAIIFVFFLPSFVEVDEQGQPLEVIEMPEIIGRLVIVFVGVIVGIIFVVGILALIYEFFFKKKELHIVKEHHKIVKEAALLNPVETMNSLVLTGRGKIQHYRIGKIVGHTQVPVKFERSIIVDGNGKEAKTSESTANFTKRVKAAKEAGHDRYDFFAFITSKGVYGLPIFNLLEPPKIFACYPTERSPDLLGDVEVYDVGTWKISGVNIFIPGQRAKEPMLTVKEIEAQLMPIAYLGIIDYVGLVAQRGIEGDTSMQKWLQAKAAIMNIKESSE